MKIKTLQQAIQHFDNEQTCIDEIAQLRWPDGKPTCPACGKQDHYYLASQKRWKCKECWKQFSVKVGTVMEDSPIPLNKWLLAMWMLANCKNGAPLTRFTALSGSRRNRLGSCCSESGLRCAPRTDQDWRKRLYRRSR